MKAKIKDMLAFYAPKAVRTNNTAPVPTPARQAGYVMGGDGRVATDSYIKQRAQLCYPDNWQTYYESYKKWIGHEVYDCNALAEVYYRKATGESIDTKAKYNFSGWCSKKSNDKADRLLVGLPQTPGVALFSGGGTSDDISHVGFLFEKTGSNALDWLVLEARGRNYGVVITTLGSRPWAYWGVMDKYFEYDREEEQMKVLAIESPLMRGDDIKSLQTALLKLGYDCGDPDGICGKQTMEAVELFCQVHGKNSLPDNVTATVMIGDTNFMGTLKRS